MSDHQTIVSDLKQECLDKLSNISNDLYSAENINKVTSRYIELILKKDQHYLESLRLLEKEDTATYGKEVVTLLNQFLIYRLYCENYDLISKLKLPKKVIEYISEDFSRALKYGQKGNSKFLTFANYPFLSYIEILCFQRFPVGHQNLEITGFSRRILFKQPLSKKISLAKLLLLNGGNSPYFEMHFNPHRGRQFNPEGWEEVFRLSSELLDFLPQVKGLFGGAWFFDDALKTISPELNYIRELGELAGGKFYLSNNSDGAEKNALQMSKARQQAFEQGAYLPTNYLLIIPRKRLALYAKSLKVRSKPA